MGFFKRSSMLHTSQDTRMLTGGAVAAGLFVVAVLLSIGLTGFQAMAYITDDGFAVPQGSLTNMLKDDETEQVLELLPVAMGDVLYTRKLGSHDYYVGEEKTEISSGYPVYTRSGQILYFLDDTLSLVTADWTTLDTYAGLYETDGMSFNADSSQADIDEVLLVQVEGGYMVAQATVLFATQRTADVPMNSVCAFRQDAVLYYSFDGKQMVGDRMPMTSGSTITIGEHSYSYQDFLRLLGVWEENREQAPDRQRTETEEPPTDSVEPNEELAGGEESADSERTGSRAVQQIPKNASDETFEGEESDEGDEGDWEDLPSDDSGDGLGNEEYNYDTMQFPSSERMDGTATFNGEAPPPSNVFEQPSAARANSNGTQPPPPANQNQEEGEETQYQEPTVTFSKEEELQPWVYTISANATISDPANRLTGSGVQVSVYPVDGETGEIGAKRVNGKAVSMSGEFVLTPLEPGKKYYIEAKYTFNDRLNYPQERTVEIGYAETKPFESIRDITISLRDDNWNTSGLLSGESERVRIHSNQLEARHFVFSDIDTHDPNMLVEVGEVSKIQQADVLQPENYINTMEIWAKNGNRVTELKMDSTSLRLLRAGYTLNHWQTAEGLIAGTSYTYTFYMKDRYGNVFTDGHVVYRDYHDEQVDYYQGHTCLEMPDVMISVPGQTNVPGSSVITVNWSNKGRVDVVQDPRSDERYTDEPVSLYLVKKGNQISPENAIALNAVRALPGGGTITKTGEKFLPLNYGTESVSTTWEITNLTPMQEYTACVLCGYFDVLDDLYHYSETIEETTDFLTASLTNLGTIPYIYSINPKGYDTARLLLRIPYNKDNRYFDDRLLNFVTYLDLTLSEKDSGTKLGTVQLTKENLSGEEQRIILYDPVLDENTGLHRIDVPVPIIWNGAERPATISLLYGDDLPVRVKEDSSTVTSDCVWDFILNTSGVEEDCWIALNLGTEMPATADAAAEKLMTLAPRTEYIGKLLFYAVQGELEPQNVSNISNPDILFTTSSQDAVAAFSHAFISSTFIELLDLEILDPDNCIMEDNLERGGNVLVEILDAQYKQRIKAEYIDSANPGRSGRLRISGLEDHTKYCLRFQAPRYLSGGVPYQNRDLMIQTAEMEDADDPTLYYFETGASVTGSLSLNSVSQVYEKEYEEDDDLTALGILTPYDIYDGIWRDGQTTYYTTDADDQFYELMREKEDGEFLDLYEYQIRNSQPTTGNIRVRDLAELNNASRSTYIPQYGWTTKFIKVSPYQKFVLFNTGDISDFRITFYYRNNGMLAYGTQYTLGSYYRGSVFRVPNKAVTNTAGNYEYMSISGYTLTGREGMILIAYDDARCNTLGRRNLLLDDTSAYHIKLQTESTLNTSGGLTTSPGYSYVSTYIPVKSGSVYEIAGRNPNFDLSVCMDNANATNSLVLFYDSRYNFLGSYYVGDQLGMVKAPFGAAWCRFNVKQDSRGATTYYDPVEAKLSMREYIHAQSGEYIASVGMELDDSSDEAYGLLRGAGWTVKLYQLKANVNNSVTDASDLSLFDQDSDGDMSKTEEERQRLSNWVENPDQRQGGDVSPETSLPFQTEFALSELPSNWGFKATLVVTPWKSSGDDTEILLDTIYFTTRKVVRTISNLPEFRAMRNDPAGSYLVVADIEGVANQILDASRPFTGIIDFQGHKITVDQTSYAALFNRVSSTGVVKNLNLYYTPVNGTANTPQYYYGTVASYNYGTLQNVVVHYGPQFTRGLSVGLWYSGGICAYNYGKIDGFVVDLLRDINVREFFGGICYINYGDISNGYVTGEMQANGRRAALIHVNPEITNADNGTVSTSSYVRNVAYGVGFNTSRATINNVYVVTDQLILQSQDVNADEDYTFPGATRDQSTLSTHQAALLVGQNLGELHNAFTVGDRVDQSAENLSFTRPMTDRGPAVAHVAGTYLVDNVVYFSDYRYNQYDDVMALYETFGGYKDTYRNLAVNIGNYNQKGEWDSLSDWHWYEGILGTDGDRFAIRSNLEMRSGYFPKLILPEGFASDAQPDIPLPSQISGRIRIIDNKVRMEGENEALVTLTLENVGNRTLKTGVNNGVVIVDSEETRLGVEVVAQRAVGDSYRVDILISNQGKTQDNVSKTVKSENQYEIRSVRFEGATVDTPVYSDVSEWNRTGNKADNENPNADVRYIHYPFWTKIDSIDAYAEKVTSSANDHENFLLTADMDFSEKSYGSKLPGWFTSDRFYGQLDGGIYEYTEQALTNDAGEEILNEETGKPRTMLVRKGLLGMHKISGVGNTTFIEGVAYDEHPITNRYTSANRGSLFQYFYGTLKNIVFEHFGTRGDIQSGAGVAAANSSYAGVIYQMSGAAMIDNCHVRDSYFTGSSRVGALVGYMVNGTIQNCSVGNTQVTNFRNTNGTATINVGGLVGRMDYGMVRNCYTNGINVLTMNVYNSEGVGGLIGYLYYGTVQDCYTTGRVNASCSNVGGVVGRMVDSTCEVRGCWSNTTVMTASDYAGGITGYRAAGVLMNNYTMGTLITRSLSANYVHRIYSSATSFVQDQVENNYAYDHQYMTYTDPSLEPALSRYQFGIWSNTDGATDLLDASKLRDDDVWLRIIGVNEDAYDLVGFDPTLTGDAALICNTQPTNELGRAVGVSFSGGTRWTTYSQGYLPKLKHTETGKLLYDQPDMAAGAASSMLLSAVRVEPTDEDTFHVQLGLFGEREDLLTAAAGNLAKWMEMNIIGAYPRITDNGDGTFTGLTVHNSSYFDGKIYPTPGRRIEFDVLYGDSVPSTSSEQGRYLDSFILTLPVYADAEKTASGIEDLQVRLSLSTGDAAYKPISSIDDWNRFFNPTGVHASAYENIRILHDLDFNGTDSNGIPAYMNVQANRVTGPEGGYRATITGLNLTNPTNARTLFSTVATELSGLKFKDIMLDSAKNASGTAWNGSENKGIVGVMQGSIRNVDFENVTIKSGTASYVGMIGRLYSDAVNIKANNVHLISRSGSYGGLIGWADSAATLSNITVTNSEFDRGTGGYTGAVAGALLGLGHDLYVSNVQIRTGGERVGGAVGSLTGLPVGQTVEESAEKAAQRKLERVYVGCAPVEKYTANPNADPGELTYYAWEDNAITQKASDDSAVPGVLDIAHPAVVISAKNTNSGNIENAQGETMTSNAYRFGGIVGYCDNRFISDLYAYNTLVEIPNRNSGDTADDGSYAYYYAGGLVGEGGAYMYDSRAENCTVKTYGGYAGGLCYTAVNEGNTAKECAVIGSSKYSRMLGGVTGSGSGPRCIAQHCVVSGGQWVGGFAGNHSDSTRDGGVTDCVVLAKTGAGGFAGTNNTNCIDHYVVSSQNYSGEPTVSTTLTHDMISSAFHLWLDGLAENEKTKQGVYIYAEKNAGGLIGWNRAATVNNSYVGNLVTVEGGENVGGLIGVFYGWESSVQATSNRTLNSCATAADVKGSKNVGGFIGLYTKSTNKNPTTTILTLNAPVGDYMTSTTNVTSGSAYFYSLLFTGTVVGADSASRAFLVGWDECLDTPGPINSDRANDNVVTKNTSTTATANMVLYGTYFSSCRIYEGSTLGDGSTDDKLASDLSFGYKKYADIKDGRRNTPATRGNGGIYNALNGVGRQLLTVTAEDLADSTLYFGSRDGYYIGMAWSRDYWSDDSLAQLYTRTGAPAETSDFNQYRNGIEQNDLILWLDARNNTGEGYCDTTATKWRNLATGGDQDAAELVWNKKAYGGDSAISVAEYNQYMRWANDGLEFFTTSENYYARLKDTLSRKISEELNDGEFTVELVYTYLDPAFGVYNGSGILGWYQDGLRGGFSARYGRHNNNFTNYDWYAAYVRYYNGRTRNVSETSIYSHRDSMTASAKDAEGPLTRSVAFVVNKNTATNNFNAVTGNANTTMLYYMNGKAVTYSAINPNPTTENTMYRITESKVQYDNLPFPTGETGYWYIGHGGTYNQSYTRVCGVRIYKGALSAEKLKQNAEYDDWYYFGGTKPASAAAVSGNPEMWNDSVSYALYRSTDGSHNGALMTDSYSGNGSDLTRGYWYLRSASGQYSTVLEKAEDAPYFLPRLYSREFGNDYFSFSRMRYMRGQEGENSSTHELYNTEDYLLSGGYRLPSAEPSNADVLGVKDLARNAYHAWEDPIPLMGAARPLMAMRAMRPAVVLPTVTAYASGVDRVNLELLSDVPAGLTYRVLVGEEEKLSGEWPEDSRTLTMTWDYDQSFKLELSLSGTTSETDFSYGTLARSVMTSGRGYWYLYGTECYDSSGETVNAETEFFHMMDGMLLAGDGTIYDAESGAATGMVTPYEIAETTPVWSGTLLLDGDTVTVESYGTYLVCDGSVKNTQLVVKGDVAYTMPGSGIKTGSFVVDSYGESLYATVLGTDGMLVDMGTPLCYPENFANANIRETSSTLGYNGQIVLVRYNSGKLMGFNYITGEEETVLSDETQALSFMEFIGEAMSNLAGSGRALLSGSASQALNALTYQNEVTENASLRTALARMTPKATDASNNFGEGSGVDGKTSGGIDGEPQNRGIDGDSGAESLAIAGQTPKAGDAVEGGVLAEAGAYEVDGVAEISGKATSGNGSAAPTEDGRVADGDSEESGEKADEAAETPAEAEEKPDKAAKTPAEAEEKPDEAAETPAEAEEKPDEAAETPAEAEEKSDEAAETPAEAEEKPDKAAKTPAEAEEKSDEAAKTPAEAEEKSDEAAETPAEAEGKSDEAAETPAEAEKKPDEATETPAEAEEKPDEAAKTPAEAEEKADEAARTPAEAEEKADEATGTPAEAEEKIDEVVVKSTQAVQIKTRYVSVYDAETESSAVYDLKELLTQPEEELVTQNERAEQLEEMGFHTTLSTRVTPAEEHASGIRLMLLVSVSVSILLGSMFMIRRRRFDEPEK